nr:MAG TPA: hypothetical protein [Caudoviricetes sp.]
MGDRIPRQSVRKPKLCTDGWSFTTFHMNIEPMKATVEDKVRSDRLC